MATLNREWTITYGSVSIGGSSSTYYLTNQVGVMQSATSGGTRTARIMFDVVAIGSTESAFETACTDIEAEFAIPRQRARFENSSGDFNDYNPASGVNSGFDAQPEIEKSTGSRLNTGRSRLYSCSVTVTLPSSTNSLAGRRESPVAITYEPNRRQSVTLTGEYTAIGSNEAAAQYAAQIGSYETAALPSGVTWQITGEQTNESPTGKVIGFTREYRQITLPQSAAAADDADVVVQDVNVERVFTGGRATWINGVQVQPFANYSVTHMTVIDIEQTTYAGLKALWDSKFRARTISVVTDQLGRSPTAASIVDSETLRIDPENNTISGSFRYRSRATSSVVAARLDKRLTRSTGTQLTPVSTGRPHEHMRDEGPASLRLRVQLMQRVVKGTAFQNYTPPKNFVLLTDDDGVVSEREGTTANNVEFHERNQMLEYQFSIPYTGGGGSTATRTRSQFDPNTTTIQNPAGDGL